MSVADLPHVNAAINTTVAVLLLLGLVAIRKGERQTHQRLMTAALALSAIFLVSYVTYHYTHGSTKFRGEGIVRPIYFTILLTHTVLAVINLPFVIVTVARAWRGDFAKHKKIAKVTWYMWFYVAVTGPIVYLMLYQLYPASAGAELPPEASAPGAAIFSAARAEHESGKEKEALIKYREAAAQGHVGASCFASVLGARLEETGTASVALAAALQKAPNDPSCLTLMGRERVYEDRLDDARATLERAVLAAPADAFAQASLAFALFRAEDYGAAAAHFVKAAQLDPERGMYAYNAAYAYFLGGKYKDARPYYVKALALGLDEETKVRAEEELGMIDGAVWICPMHPEERGHKGDKCSQCGMKLQPVSAGAPDL